MKLTQPDHHLEDRIRAIVFIGRSEECIDIPPELPVAAQAFASRHCTSRHGSVPNPVTVHSWSQQSCEPQCLLPFQQFLIYALRREANARPTTVLHHHEAFSPTQVSCTSENLWHERNIPRKSCSAANPPRFRREAFLGNPHNDMGPPSERMHHLACEVRLGYGVLIARRADQDCTLSRINWTQDNPERRLLQTPRPHIAVFTSTSDPTLLFGVCDQSLPDSR